MTVGRGCRNSGSSSGNKAYIAVKRPGSDSVGYDLNVAIIPSSMKVANNGSCPSLTIIGIGYINRCIEKQVRKNRRKWSKISVKKYHQRPGLGVRSGSRITAPHVRDIQEEDPIRYVDKLAKMARYAKNSASGFNKEEMLGIRLEEGFASADVGLD